MTRKRVTASEKRQRHEWAVRQIDAGMGLSELTAVTAETWGCSRRNARDVVYFGAPQIVVDPFRGGISGTTHVQVLNAMDLAVTHQSAICVGSA